MSKINAGGNYADYLAETLRKINSVARDAIKETYGDGGSYGAYNPGDVASVLSAVQYNTNGNFKRLRVARKAVAMEEMVRVGYSVPDPEPPRRLSSQEVLPGEEV